MPKVRGFTTAAIWARTSRKGQQRENRLVELWEHIEAATAPDGQAEWNSLTFRVGREIAKGNRYVVIERGDNSPEAFARYLHRLQFGLGDIRKVRKCYDKDVYKHRNQIERFFGRIKRCRRVATRYEKRPSTSPTSSGLPPLSSISLECPRCLEPTSSQRSHLWGDTIGFIG